MVKFESGKDMRGMGERERHQKQGTCQVEPQCDPTLSSISPTKTTLYQIYVHQVQSND